VLVIDEPVQLPFRQQSIDKVETTKKVIRGKCQTRGNNLYLPEIPDVNFAKSEGLNHPLVLRVPITVFVSPESMGNTLYRINGRAREIVGRVNLPLVPVGKEESDHRQVTDKLQPIDVPSTMVRQRVASVDDGISEGLVGVVYAELGSDAPPQTFS
jgi:hypothetical protein